jgi:hypothetical protein
MVSALPSSASEALRLCAWVGVGLTLMVAEILSIPGNVLLFLPDTIPK